jgi:hypothetical protein
MKTPEETLLGIIDGLSKIVCKIIEDKHKSLASHIGNKIGKALQIVAKSAAKTAISHTGLDGKEIVDGLSGGGSANSQTILGLRNSLEEVIGECLALDSQAGKPKKGFLFFIDDLDRIDPPVAVNILELIKNIFEVDNCIFILAIDYDVVVKGLEPKFGPLTEKNEREFRSFFDKIIQLPFSMPLGSYTINEFLIQSLIEVNYLDEKLKSNEEFCSEITEMALSSVGTNPRSLKRLINTLSLIQIMNELEEGAFGESSTHRLINFGLVCMQIAFPSFYEIVGEQPDFSAWDDSIAQRLRLKDLTEDERRQLDQTDEFDEEWEKIVYRIAQLDPYLRNKAFSVSTLMNLIKNAVPVDADFGKTIESILSMSSVTSVEMDKKSRAKPLSKKDHSKFVFNGIELTKGRLVLEVVRKYANDNPAVNYEQLESVFPKKLQGSMGVFAKKSDAIEKAEKTGSKRHYLKEDEIIKLADCDIAVCTQWGANNIPNIMSVFKKLGYQS